MSEKQDPVDDARRDTPGDEVSSHPLSPRLILEGFRDLGVDTAPALSPALACDPSFNRYSAYWLLGPTLDSTYPALDGLALAPPGSIDSSVFESRRSDALRFLASHFDGSRFSTDSSPRTRGIFAPLAAINMMKSLTGRGFRQALTEDRFRKLMTMIAAPGAGASALTGIEDLLAECRSSDGEGLIENPAKPLIPSLTALSTASSVLWNLWPEKPRRGLRRYFPLRALQRFVSGCLRRQEAGGTRLVGFSIHPDIDQLCVNTTFFGLRLMRRLQIDLEPEDRDGIEAFLCRSYKDGGFSSTLEEPRSLNATFFGLRALEMLGSALWSELKSGQRRLVAAFVRSCRHPASRGFAFSTDHLRYRENCLASRYALQILETIGEPVPDGTERFFLRLFDERSGGFSAYPAEAVDTDELGAAEVERYLEDKDSRLIDSFCRQSQAHRADRERRRIDALYDRLAEIEEGPAAAPREHFVEIGHLREELRSLQRQRAQRYERYVEEHVLDRLNAGAPLLERAKQLLAR